MPTLSPPTTPHTETVVLGPPVPADTTPERGEATAPMPAYDVPDTSRALTALLALLAIIVTASWWMLHQWYGLLENRDNTHFAFEKIEGGFDSPIMRQTALVFVVLTACFAATIMILHALPTLSWGAKTALGAVAGGAALVNVLLYPVGALDVFNYMIELKLAFHFDQNPYVVTFEAYRDDPYALPAFLVNIKLFYGPAWLLAMWIPSVISGFSDVIQTLIALKVFNVVVIGITGYLIGRYQSTARMGWVTAALFVANPLVLFEGVANGHNDVLLTVFVVGAMVALKRNSPLAGPLLALSALVKLYTVALVPIFVVVALKRRWGWKRVAVTVGLTAFTVAIVCAPYWGDGKLVDGMRDGLTESQEMDHVSLLSLAKQYAQQQEAEGSLDRPFLLSRPAFEVVPETTMNAITTGFTIAFVIALVVIALAVWRGHPPELAAAETILAVLLLMTNLYPWYLIPVIAVLALRPDRLNQLYIVIASGLALVYYPMFIYGHFTSGWQRFEVHQFLALFLTLPILLYIAARFILSGRGEDAVA